MENSFLGWFVTVCLEEMDYLDIGDGQRNSFEGDGDLGLCRP